MYVFIMTALKDKIKLNEQCLLVCWLKIPKSADGGGRHVRFYFTSMTFAIVGGVCVVI